MTYTILGLLGTDLGLTIDAGPLLMTQPIGLLTRSWSLCRSQSWMLLP